MLPVNRFPRLSRLLAVALLAASVTACGGGREVPARHVVLVTIDTLRADHLGAYDYPRDTSPTLDRLAGEGVVFERAIAQWPKTGSSFASIFTGQYPQTTGLTHEAAVRIPDGYLTLPELFRHEGFTTLAVTSNAVLSEKLGWSTGFDDFTESWAEDGLSEDPVEYRRSMFAGKVNRKAFAAFERHSDAERIFAWIHYSDPHTPYLLPDGEENPFLGDELFAAQESSTVKLDRPRGKALGDETDLRYYVAQYDANIRVTDRAIGELLRFLDEKGILAESLIVVTADHGESLGEHGLFFEHGPLPYNASSHVPLLFAGAGVTERGSRVPTPVELIDLYPTLRDVVAPGQKVAGLQGASLVDHLSELSGESAEPSYAFAQAGGQHPLRHYRSVQDERWKLIYHPAVKRRRGPREAWWELYELSTDGTEARNRIGEGLDEERRLKRELSRWMDGGDWLRRSAEAVEERSEETLKALRALGYVQ